MPVHGDHRHDAISSEDVVQPASEHGVIRVGVGLELLGGTRGVSGGREVVVLAGDDNDGDARDVGQARADGGRRRQVQESVVLHSRSKREEVGSVRRVAALGSWGQGEDAGVLGVDNRGVVGIGGGEKERPQGAAADGEQRSEVHRRRKVAEIRRW